MALLSKSTAAVEGIGKVIKHLLTQLTMSHSQIVHEFVNQSMNANQIKADFLRFFIFNQPAPLEGASSGFSLVKMQNFLISTQFALLSIRNVKIDSRRLRTKLWMLSFRRGETCFNFGISIWICDEKLPQNGRQN